MATSGIKMNDKKERKRLGAEWKALSEEEQVIILYLIILFSYIYSLYQFVISTHKISGTMERQISNNKGGF